MDLTKRQLMDGMDEEPRHHKDRSRASEFEAMRRRAARRAKLAAHFAFLHGDPDTDVDDLFACIESGITAAPTGLAAEWR